MGLKEISSKKSFGGWQKVFEHESEETKCAMKFGVFFPPQVRKILDLFSFLPNYVLDIISVPILAGTNFDQIFPDNFQKLLQNLRTRI